jgi:hypothetical protein
LTDDDATSALTIKALIEEVEATPSTPAVDAGARLKAPQTTIRDECDGHVCFDDEVVRILSVIDGATNHAPGLW